MFLITSFITILIIIYLFL